MAAYYHFLFFNNYVLLTTAPDLYSDNDPDELLAFACQQRQNKTIFEAVF